VLAEVHQQVAGLLDHPRSGGVDGDPGEVKPAGLHFDHEQDVQPGQADGLDGEEVTGEQPTGLGPDELRVAVSLTPLAVSAMLIPS
jgi:hypothetical protein